VLICAFIIFKTSNAMPISYATGWIMALDHMAYAVQWQELVGLIAAMFVLFLTGLIVLYLYYALVFSTLAKKLGHKDIAWLSWVPIANMAMMPILAKKKWTWVFMLLLPVVNVIFVIFWMWRIYERRNYPGELSLVLAGVVFPLFGLLAFVGHLVISGIVAFVDKKK
jgi:hypothetical protein